jgi:hypothetical protein
MRSHAAPVAVVLALLLVTTGATAALQSSPATDEPRVEIDVRLASDGDARWSISTRFALNSSNETRAFERLAEEYESGQDVGFSASEFRDVARSVADETGRDMAITRVNRTAYVTGNGTNKTGVLALEFTWTEFARVEGDRVVVDDAFSGGWLDRLSETQVLRLHAPDGYGVDTAVPGPSLESGTATWTGPREFESGQPRVVFLQGLTTTTTSPGPDDPTDGVQMVLLVLVALLAGGLLVYWWTQRGSDEDAASAAAESERDTEEAAATADAEQTEPSPGEADGAGSAAVVEEAVDDGVDPDLLSDEERVERLLRQNGGRMKQGDIVSETGWSNAKVSQLLSSMAEEERVEKLRIGRENLITLADGDADDLG